MKPLKLLNRIVTMIKVKVARVFYGADTEPTSSLPVPAEEIAARSIIAVELLRLQ
jgi:hypothetical protein